LPTVSKSLICFALAFAIAFPAFAGEAREKKNLVGYFAAWNVYARGYTAKSIDTTESAAKLTHINYAFANISPNLRAQLGDAHADIQMPYTAATSVDGVADADGPTALRGSFNQLRKLKARHPHLKVLISIGGWTWSSKFSDAALTEQSRATFVSSCIDLFIKGQFSPTVRQPGVFDGIDIDWEYPGAPGASKNFRPEDGRNFTALLAEFRKQLDAQGTADGKRYLLTIATSASPGTYAKLELDRIHPHLDWINLMTYDLHGAWENTTNFQSALFAAPSDPSEKQKLWCDAAVRGYLTAGVPASKLHLGIPFYGRGWAGVEPGPDGTGLFQKAPGGAPIEGSTEKGMSDFRILKNLGPAFKPHWHAEAKAFWVYNTESKVLWTYDNAEAMHAKAAYIQQNNLGGAMIWELGGDDTNATLLNALGKGLIPNP